MSFTLPPAKKKKGSDHIHAITTTGSLPHYKVKSSTAVTDGGYLFLFGGFDEDDILDSNVYLLNLNTNQWEVHKHDITREGHSAIYIGNNNILVFGGVQDDSSDSCQMLIYNIDEYRWITAPEFTLFNHPSERSRHAACLSEDGTKMYVSGGILNSTPLDDLYCYNLITGKWDGPMKFVCRFDHFITVYQNKIYSFGGLNKEMNHVRSKISWFDLSNNMIGEISMINSVNLLGDHVYLNSIDNSIKLDITMPIWNSIHEGVQSCIATYDIKHLKWQMLLTGNFIPLIDHRWKHTFIYNEDLYLLGYPLTTENSFDVTSFDYKLSTIIKIDLTNLGILKNDITTTQTIPNSLSSDFSEFYYNKDWTDFEIIALDIKDRVNIETQSLEYIDSIKVSLHVHKSILLARWPHFRRLMSSGMEESISNKMFLPEPMQWVKGLVHYLYTDTIDGFGIEELSGILILSNLYEIKNLRKKIINKLYNEINFIKLNDILKIWQNFKTCDEFYLVLKLNKIISLNWSKIVKSKEFEELPKDMIIMLCQDCSDVIGNAGSGINENMLLNKEESPNGIIESNNVNSNLIFEELRRENTNSPFLINQPQLSIDAISEIGNGPNGVNGDADVEYQSIRLLTGDTTTYETIERSGTSFTTNEEIAGFTDQDMS